MSREHLAVGEPAQGAMRRQPFELRSRRAPERCVRGQLFDELCRSHLLAALFRLRSLMAASSRCYTEAPPCAASLPRAGVDVVVAVIQDDVSLRKAGASDKGSCPFPVPELEAGDVHRTRAGGMSCTRERREMS